MKVSQYLEDNHVDFDVLPHERTFEAQRMAAALHVPGQEVAKTVLLRADSGNMYVVAVLPAHKSVHCERASRLIGEALELATENEISQQCPDCETGALPPFGSHYNFKTIVDRGLAEDYEIVFEGNSHDEAIRMKFEDFFRLEEPLLGTFAS